MSDGDGDGRGDLLIGADNEFVGGTSGRAYYFSGATGNLLRTVASPNSEVNGDFAIDVSGVPDDDGEGGGILIGAWREDGGASNAGRAYVFSGFTVANENGPDAADFSLRAAPNPLRDRATFRFALPAPGPVRLAVYDVLGREVAVVVEGTVAAGPHEAALDVERLPPGAYLLRLTAGSHVATQRLTLVR